jgi:hypothetical protein
MMTQNEAIETSLMVTTAMMANDRDTRNKLMDELSADDLKRVLRWTTRFQVRFFVTTAMAAGATDPSQLWTQFCQQLYTEMMTEGDQA